MAYIATSFSFGEQPSAAKWNQLTGNDSYFDSLIGSGTAGTTWTPTWTNVTIGNATVSGKYQKFGKQVVAHLNVTWGGTTSAAGNIVFSLPATSIAYAGTATITPIGFGNMYDQSAGIVYDSNVLYTSTTTVTAVVKTASTSFVQPSTATNTSPVTWASPDEWSWTLVYEAA